MPYSAEIVQLPVSGISRYPAKLIYLNFQPLKVVSRYRDPQLQMAENYSFSLNLRPNILKMCQGERTKFDKFVDPNVRGTQRRVYLDLRIYRN